MVFVVGFLLLFAGMWGSYHWYTDVASFARGFFPLLLLVAGVIALIAGLGKFSSPRSDAGKKKQ